jgi:hypothetical protein
VSRKGRFRCWWLLLVVPCLVYFHILLLWLTFTNFFPTTLLLSYAYEENNGSVRAEDLAGDYVATWPDSRSTDTLQLLADGRMLQHVDFGDGRTEDHQGTWEYNQATGSLALTGRLDLYDKDHIEVNGPEDHHPYLIVPKNRVEFEIAIEGVYQGRASVKSSPPMLHFTGRVFNVLCTLLGQDDSLPLMGW